MRSIVFAVTIAATLALAPTTTTAGPLNCEWDPIYAPGPADLDPDGDGVWFEPGQAIAQTGPIIGWNVTCEGVESEEVEP